MQYQIIKYQARNKLPINISESKYHSILKAWQCLLDAYLIEQKFTLLLENYLELELDISLNIINQDSWNEHSWNEGVNFIHHCNRRVLNLLTTCRAYLDQLPIHLRAYSTEDVKYKDIFKKITSDVYDSCFSYRLLEAIRNHAQHYALPLDGTNITSKRIDREDKRINEQNLELTINVMSLLKNKKFKLKGEVKEKCKDKSLDIRPHIYEYILDLAKIHRDIRSEIENDVIKSQNHIKESIQKYCNTEPQNSHGFGIRKASEQNIDIFWDPITQRKDLIERFNDVNLDEKVSIPIINEFNETSILSALKAHIEHL